MKEAFQRFEQGFSSVSKKEVDPLSGVQAHGNARERRDVVRQRADKKVLSWMEKVGSDKRFLHLCKILHVVNLWGVNSNLDITDDVRTQEVVLTSPETSSSMQVDSGFQREGIRPETIRTLLEGTLGKEAVDQNIRRVIYSPVEIPMASHYRGTQRYEAGHCTRSMHPGERSDVVLTPSAFRDVTAREIVTTILHESAGHALDYQNDERMTVTQRFVQSEQVHRLVQGDRLTIYDYSNNYQHGSLTPEQEDDVQAEEVFAEVVADGLTLPVMDANNPLRRLSLREQMMVRLAERHDISQTAAAPYADILVSVAAVRGADFFERGQVAAARAQQAIQMQLNIREHRAQSERIQVEQRQLSSELERLAIPHLSVALQHWRENHLDSREEDIRTQVKSLDSIQADAFEARPNDSPERRRELRQLRERYDRLMDRLQADWQAYPQVFMRDVHNPALRSLFARLTKSFEKRSTGLLERLHTAHGSSPETVRALVTEFNRIMDTVNDPAIASPQERAQFQEMFLRYVEDTARGGYYQHIGERVPDFVQVIEDIDRLLPAPDSDEEGNSR
ncbi:hypothetical protein KBB27_03415 [Patescibacteria group bacterium]|nr:hypothetical protein [Patescibacteria group bacterium]